MAEGVLADLAAAAGGCIAHGNFSICLRGTPERGADGTERAPRNQRNAEGRPPEAEHGSV